MGRIMDWLMRHIMDGSDTMEREESSEWSLTITRIDNGLMLTGSDGSKEALVDDANGMDEDKNAAEMGLRLCYHVLGYFTLGGDKWSQYTVTVEIEPGRKWAEAKDEEPDELKPGDKVRYTGKRPIMLGLEGEFLEHIKTGKGERARVKGADNQIHYIETGDLEYIGQ